MIFKKVQQVVGEIDWNYKREDQIRASVKVHVKLLKFYWELGEEIVKKQKNSNWGSAFLKNLSQDLMREFPDVKGFSYRNIKYIRQWYLFYSTNTEKRQQVVALLTQIPWGHNLHIITKCKEINQALYYSTQTLKYGWSRAVLTHQILTMTKDYKEFAFIGNQKREL